MATPHRRPFDSTDPPAAIPTTAATRRVVPPATQREAEAATGGASRVSAAGVAEPTAADAEGRQSSTSFAVAVCLALLGTVLLFVNTILGGVALALSVGAILWAAYGLGIEAWRSERATRHRPHPDAPDGMPE